MSILSFDKLIAIIEVCLFDRFHRFSMSYFPKSFVRANYLFSFAKKRVSVSKVLFLVDNKVYKSFSI